MSLFERLREISLASMIILAMGLARISIHSLTKMVGHGFRLQDLFGEEKTSLRASTSDIGVKVWSMGGVCRGETCTPVQSIVSRRKYNLQHISFLHIFQGPIICKVT